MHNNTPKKVKSKKPNLNLSPGLSFGPAAQSGYWTPPKVIRLEQIYISRKYSANRRPQVKNILRQRV